MMKSAFAVLALATTMTAQASVLISEGFEDVSGLAAKGWTFVNNSNPSGPTVGWFQGNVGVFDAQAGAANSYAAANYNNSLPGGAIESLLITPEFKVGSGVDVSFYLRADEGEMDRISFGFTGYPDALPLTIIDPVPEGEWTRYTAHLNGGITDKARFQFSYYGDADSLNYVGLDTLDISNADADVPEPASLALVAGGLMGLAAFRRRARG